MACITSVRPMHNVKYSYPFVGILRKNKILVHFCLYSRNHSIWSITYVLVHNLYIGTLSPSLSSYFPVFYCLA